MRNRTSPSPATPATARFFAASARLGAALWAAEREVWDAWQAAKRELEAARFATQVSLEAIEAQVGAGTIDEFQAAEQQYSLWNHLREISDEIGLAEQEILTWRRSGRLADPYLVEIVLGKAK